MTVDVERCSLLPTPHKKSSAQALQATMGKYLFILTCHGHLFTAKAAFHSNCLNLTNTVAMTQCFPYAVMPMKRIDHIFGCGGLGSSASPQTPCLALLRTWGQVTKAGDRSFLSCLLIHTGPVSSLELELPHAPVSREDGNLSLLVTLPSPKKH